jgi:NAD(P)H-hydrate epimerase
MRSSDEYTIKVLGIPAQTLMKRAGKCVAKKVEEVLTALNKSKVLVVCGRGNNGGDGYVCATLLNEKGIDVSVYSVDGKRSPECAEERKKYKGKYSEKIEGDVIVDCLLGTGFKPPLSDNVKKIINDINSSKAYVISVDIPSGLSGDNGLGDVCVRANLTLAIAEYKMGYVLQNGPYVCGEKVKCDIGIVCKDTATAKLVEDGDVAKLFPKRARNTHKGSYGTATLIAGSEKYVGAAALSLSAALKSGAGYVKLFCDEKTKYALAPVYPSAIYSNEVDLTSDCIAIGMGCGISDELYEKIKYLLNEYTGTLIIDADGINTLAKCGTNVLKGAKCKVVLTPHIKEFSRICKLYTNEIVENPIDACTNFAKEFGVTVLLKGSTSVLSDGVKTVVVDRGSTALAKAGSGDMLSGFMCGSIARGLSPFNGAMCSAYVLGKAGEYCSNEVGDYAATSADVLKNLPYVVKSLTQK